MRTQKFSHMKGGKVFGVILPVLVIGLIAVVVLLFIDKSVDVLSTIIILVTVGSFVWLTYRLYKPAFTDVVFSDDGIVSKTHFEQEKLSVSDIKGIWYFKNTQSGEPEIKPYSDKAELKNCVIVIGDINCFNGVEYVGMNGISILRDSFRKGYTTLHYRKELDETLQYYNSKIKNSSLA